MKNYLLEIKSALDAHLYTLAIVGALSLPDICASLESSNPNNKSDVGKRYKKWYKKYAEKNCYLTPEVCYLYRCSMVHQHSSQNQFKFTMTSPFSPSQTFTYNKIAFFLPSPSGPKFNNCGVKITMTNADNGEIKTDEALLIEIDEFVNGMLQSVYDWLSIIKEDKNYKKNINDLIQPRPMSTLNAIKGDYVIY